MYISAFSSVLPKYRVRNSQIVEAIHKNSIDSMPHTELKSVLDRVSATLDKIGLVTRSWTFEPDGKEDLKQITTDIKNHIKDSVAEAIHMSGIPKKELESEGILIHAAVDRRFHEPGDSHFVSALCGLNSIECFDVLSACNSVLRAMNLAKALLYGDRYKHVIIVSPEFNNTPGTSFYPSPYRLTKESDLAYRLPAFTMGEAVTCLILSKQSDLNHQSHQTNFKFSWRAQNQYAPLCLIPHKNYQVYEEFIRQSGLDWPEEIEINSFYSFGKQLHEVGTITTMPAVQALDRELISTTDVILTNGSNIKTYLDILPNLLKLSSDKLHFTFPTTGNLVASAFTASLSSAVQAGKLKRNNKVLFIGGAAGMSGVACHFTF